MNMVSTSEKTLDNIYSTDNQLLNPNKNSQDILMLTYETSKACTDQFQSTFHSKFYSTRAHIDFTTILF